MPKRPIKIEMPFGGMDRRLAYTSQIPYTSPSCQNVRPDGSVAHRERFGSRPGTARLFAQQISGASNAIRLLTDTRFIASNALREKVIASANGELWRDQTAGTMSQLSTSITLSSDKLLLAADHLQKVYIADWDAPVDEATDGVTSSNALTSTAAGDFAAAGVNATDYVVVITSGSTVGTYKISSVVTTTININATVTDDTGVSFRVQRAPMVYDPVADTLAIWFATSGTEVPTGCSIITLWRDRVCLAGQSTNPHVWFLSAMGDPLDWDTSTTGPTRAIVGNNADAGQLGAPITALVPHHDDCLIMGSATSIWSMRGDPAQGGTLDLVSPTIGIIDKNAWCHSPEGYLFFMSDAGLYVMHPGCGSPPYSVSREKLPKEMLNIDTSTTTVSLEYDTYARGIHVFLTQSAQQTHYFIDERTSHTGDKPAVASYFPVLMVADQEAASLFARRDTASSKSVVMVGGKDGYIRIFDDTVSQDDGSNAIASFVDIGPIRIGDGYNDGLVSEITGTTSTSSGDVDWALRVGTSAESCFDASARESGSWNDANISYTEHPRARGQFLIIKLTNGEANAEWAMEDMRIVVEPKGKTRR